MEGTIAQYPPGDPKMIDTIVHQLKSQGIFDQFRKECIADVDTKPAYQNLHQRVEGSVSGFLTNQVWRPDLNKNLLRDSLRKHIHESGFLEAGVERIVDQVVNPKIMTVFVPQVEDVVYNFLGIEKPKKRIEALFSKEVLYSKPPPFNFNIDHSEIRKDMSLTDMLPKDLDPVSPESDGTKKADNSPEEGELDDKDDEECSPAFKPIRNINEDSGGSSLSGISGLTSPDSHHSNISFNGVSQNVIRQADIFNSDRPFARVSSENHIEKSQLMPIVQTCLNESSNRSTPPIKLPNQSLQKPIETSKVVSDSDSSDDEDKNGSTSSSRPSSSNSNSSSGSSSDSSSSDSSACSKPESSEVMTSLYVGEEMVKNEKIGFMKEDKLIKSEHSNVYDEEKLKFDKKEIPLLIKSDKIEKGAAICKEKIDVFASKINPDLGEKVIKKEKKDLKGDVVFTKLEKEEKPSRKVEKEESLVKKVEREDNTIMKKDEKEKRLVKTHEKDEKPIKRSEKIENSTRKPEKEEKSVKKSGKEGVEHDHTVKREMKDDKSNKKVNKDEKLVKRDEKDNSNSANDKSGTNKTVSKEQRENKSSKNNEKGFQKNGDGKSSSKDVNLDKKSLKKDNREDKTPKKDDKGTKREEKPTKNFDKEKIFKKEEKHKTDTDSSSQDSKPADRHTKTSDSQHQSNKIHKSSDKESAKQSVDTSKQASKDDRTRKDGKSKSEDKSKYGDKYKNDDKIKHDYKSKQHEKPKNDGKTKEDDKARHEDKHKTKNGKSDKDKGTSNKDVHVRERHGKLDGEKSEMKSESKSKVSSKSKDNKKDKGKLTDDHSRHRDKRSDDRGSTDRDSNGATRDRSSSSSQTQTSSSKDSGSREKKSSGSSGKTGKGGNTDSSENVQNNVVSTDTDSVKSDTKSPPKRPKINIDPMIPCDGEYICTNKEGKLILKIKKPKIAANIYEVRKIMQLRRSLTILERKRQKEFQLAQSIAIANQSPMASSSEHRKDSSPGKIPPPESVASKIEVLVPTIEVLVPAIEVPGDVDVSVLVNKSSPDEVPRDVVPTPLVKPPEGILRKVDDDDDLKYFESPEVNEYDKYFIDHMKLLNESETLSEIDVCSVHSEDLDDFKDVSAYMPSSNVGISSQEKELAIKHSRTVDFCHHVSFERKALQPSDLSEGKSQITTVSKSSKKAASGTSVTHEIIPGGKNTRVASRQVKSKNKTINKVSNVSFRGDFDGKSPVPASIKSTGKLAKRLEYNASPVPTVKPQLPDDITKVGLPSKSLTSRSLHPRVNNGDFKTQTKPVNNNKTDVEDNETTSSAEMRPPAVSHVERRETRRSRKPNSRYTDDNFTSDIPETHMTPTVAARQSKMVSLGLSKSKILDIVVDNFKDEYDAHLNNNNGKVVIDNINDISSNSSKSTIKEEFKHQSELPLQSDSSAPTPESLKSSDSSSSGSCQTQTTQKTKLGPCRRLGLSRVKPRSVEPVMNQNQVARVVTPVGADFVMPLSPESDVSASSMDQAKKMLSDCTPKPEDNIVFLNDFDKRNTRRSSAVATPASRGQRYSSDDLYKPRPLFNRLSRRTRANGPGYEEVPEQRPEVVVSGTIAKRKSSNATPESAPGNKRRR